MPDHESEPKRFEPKVPVQLDPPKDDLITAEELAQADGTKTLASNLAHTHTHTFYTFLSLIWFVGLLIVLLIPGTDPSRPTWVAIKGTVFDVSKNAAYAPGGQYHGMAAILSLSFSLSLYIRAHTLC